LIEAVHLAWLGDPRSLVPPRDAAGWL